MWNGIRWSNINKITTFHVFKCGRYTKHMRLHWQQAWNYWILMPLCSGLFWWHINYNTATVQGMYELLSDTCPRSALIHMALESYRSHVANIKMSIWSCCRSNARMDFVEYLVDLSCISGTLFICVWNIVIRSELVSNGGLWTCPEIFMKHFCPPTIKNAKVRNFRICVENFGYSKFIFNKVFQTSTSLCCRSLSKFIISSVILL